MNAISESNNLYDNSPKQVNAVLKDTSFLKILDTHSDGSCDSVQSEGHVQRTKLKETKMKFDFGKEK